jgi:hypothetical protein
MIYIGADGVTKFSTKKTPKYKYKKGNQFKTYWSDTAPPSPIGVVSEAMDAKSLAAMKPYEDKFGIELLDEMAQSQYGKNWRDLDRKNQLKFFKSQLNKYEDFILVNKRYPNKSEAYRIGLVQSGQRKAFDFLGDDIRKVIKDTYSSGEGGSKYIANKLSKPPYKFKVDDGTIRRFITAEVEAGNIKRVKKFKTQLPDETLPSDRYNIVRKVTPRDLRGFIVGRSKTKVLAPPGSRWKVSFDAARDPGTTKVPSKYQGTQYYTHQADANTALKGYKKWSRDLAKWRAKNKSTRNLILEQISDLNIENAHIGGMKEGSDLATAHRLSYRQVHNLGELYNSGSLGIEDPAVNSGAIRRFENKLDLLYEEQRNLLRTARRSTNKGLAIPRNIQQRIESNNKEISAVVDLTDQRVQGILLDEKNLKPYTYGTNAIREYGMGLVDNKPVKDLTQTDLDHIALNMENQIERERALGKGKAFFLRERQPLLSYLKELTQKNWLSKIPPKLRPIALGLGFTIGGISAGAAAPTKDQVPGTVVEETEIEEGGGGGGGSEADETGITDQSMEYNSTTGEFVNTETGDPETQTGILNWIADNPGKSGFLGLPVMLGLGQAVGGMRTAPGRYLTSWTAAIPAMMIPEKMWQYKQGMEAGEMATDPLNALWALGIENKASLKAAQDWYDTLPEGQRTRLMSMQNLKDLKTTQGWKNLPSRLRTAILSPTAAGTDLAFQKRLKPATKKLTESVIGSPGAKQVAKKGLGALAKRVGIGLGAAALLPATVAAGLISAPLTLGLGALSFGYAQYKDYRDGKAIVDSMRARGKISEEDANNYMSLILQGSLPFGIGNRLFGDEEMTLRGQTLDPTQQRAVLKGMEGEIDIFQDERRDVRVLDRADDFDFFNEGGRVGMKTGGMDRRGFLKWLMGLAGTVGAGGSGLFKQGWKAPTKQVAETVAKETLTTTQPEMWVPRLIAKIKAEGKLLEMADKKYVNGDIYEHTINGKKITMESNPVTGTTDISWSAPDYDSEMTRSIQFNEGEIITEGKLAGQKTQPEVMFTEPDRSTPYRDDFSDFDPVTDADETLTSMQKWIGVEDAKTTGPKTSNYDFEEGGYEEFNTGGRIGYADRGLVGTPTDEVTQYDRRVYTTPTGEEVSEKSVTIPMGGMWINIPSIHDGREYSEDQLTEMILKGEIEPTSVHEDREEAIIVATQRSDMMKRHKKGFNTGGEVETGAIARRQSLVPPLAGPNPQGIMGLPSDVKQVRVG